MDDKSDSTPNPLNPNPAPTAQTPADQSIGAPKQSTVAQTTVVEPVAGTTEQAPAVDPTSRPMEQASAVDPQPVKKKKTSLIVGAIVCLFLAIGCGVTAALLLLTPKPDPIVAALEKIFTSSTIPNISVKGNLNFKIDNKDFPFSDMNLAINSSVVGNSSINSTDATLTATARGSGEEISLRVDEMYATSGDLYLKVDGLADTMDTLLAIQKEIDLDEESNSSESDYSSAIDYQTKQINAVVEAVDGEWFRISNDELSEYSTLIDSNDQIVCAKNFVSNISNRSNTITKIYQDNAFISSTDQNLQVQSKNNPIRLVNIDGEKLTSFIDALNDADVVKELEDCLGQKSNQVDSDNIAKLLSKLPNIYVEIDNNNDFTRIYFVTPIEEAKTTLTADIDLSYPTNINITEPNEYQDINSLMQKLGIPQSSTIIELE